MGMDKIFTDRQKVLSASIQASDYSRLSRLSSQDIKALSTNWSYFSGKIEGNTYTLVETEILLTDGITSNHPYADAVMLKNIYNTFISELQYARSGSEKAVIDLPLVMRVHSQLTHGLLDPSQRGMLRTGEVRIGATTYKPNPNEEVIAEELVEILHRQYDYPDPLERGVFLHCNLARLQPFWDGNKRTARMIEGLVQMNADIIPVFSVEAEQVHFYKNALIRFYEERDYSLYAEFTLNRHLERIRKLSPRPIDE